jgi:3-oxoacyl-[acyl-carrier protein] reductase
MRIVIIGSGGGIGKELTKNLISSEHEICKIGRSKQDGFSFQCDVSNLESIKTCVKEIEKKWKLVDALICCHGVQSPIGLTINTDPIKWSNNIDINLKGTYYAIHSFYSLLSKSLNNSKILCFSGGGSTNVRPNLSAYAVSKTGIVRLVETLATELKDKSIDINAISPGAIFTNMTIEILNSKNDAGTKEFNDAIKLSKDNTDKINKLTELVNFLLSTKSDGISGKLISSLWDNWQDLNTFKEKLKNPDYLTLRRIS